MQISKFEKILEKKEEWFKNNPDKAIKWIKKKGVESKLILESKFHVCAKLLTLNKKYLEIMPEISSNCNSAAEVVKRDIELYDLFPQFHNNLDFCQNLIVEEHLSSYSEDRAGYIYESYSNTYFQNYFKYIPDAVAKNPEFIKRLFRFDCENFNTTTNTAFSYFSKKNPSSAVEGVQDFVKEEFFTEDISISKMRCTLERYHYEIANQVFSHEFCDELRQMTQARAKKEIEKATQKAEDKDQIQRNIEKLNRIEKDYKKLIKSIDVVDSELIKAEKEQKQQALDNKIAEISSTIENS